MRLCPRCSELYPNDGAYCPMDGAELALVTDSLIGKTIAQRYRVISRLGGGGMSSVYLARHVMIDRLSAIKVLRSDLSASQAQRDRFLREARAVNRINHDNIVEITDFGEWDGLVFLVMEYIAGEPLSRYISDGALPWQRAAVIGAQIAAALARAHQMGVIHRDLKPGNILLVRRAVGEVAMLTDFGIAKILDAPTLTLTSQIFGTPGYIAPEYIEGSDADARTDLYSLGVVLYEAVSGKLPHDDKGTAPLMLQVLRNPPTPIHQHVPSLPRPFEELVMRLLSKKAHLRGRDAFEVFDQLSDMLVDDGILAAGPLFLAKPTHVSGGAVTERGVESEDASSSKPFAHLAPLCSAGLARIELELGRRGLLAPETIIAVHNAHELTRDVAIASHTVAVEQARIAELERYGRTLRASIGRALDDLGRDLSRVQKRLDDVVRRRAAAGVRRSTPPLTDGPPSNPDLWEHAALVDEEVRIQALSDDLATQIQSLRDHLSAQNEVLEGKLASTRYSLEGRVAALRTMAAEAWTVIDQVGRNLGLQALPPGSMPAGSMRRS